MKNRKWTGILGVLAAAGFALRRMVYAGAVDEKNLIVTGHPFVIALWALTAVALVLAAFAGWKQGGSGLFAEHFGASAPAFFGHGMLAAGVLVTAVLNEAAMPGLLGSLWKVLGLLTPVCLVLAGFDRLRGKMPFFGFYALACVFFAVHVVNHYQIWCREPQLAEYFFSLTAMVALTLFAYQQAAFSADTGSRRMLTFTGLAAVWLSVAELAGSMYPYLYVGVILYCLTALSKE